jgi:indole-3-glycerol phosphate synthase
MESEVNVLEKILTSTRERVEGRKASLPLDESLCRRLYPGRGLLEALARKRHGLIAEFKRASPSEGEMSSPLSLDDAVRLYNCHADAISILTEEEHFHGSLEHLSRAGALSAIPVLRKDFIIDRYQILESLSHGADAVLLIADILDGEKLRNLYHCAMEHGLDVLVEAHSPGAFEKALGLNPPLLGINNRNLDDFTIDRGRTRELSRQVSPSTILVSESGFMKIEHIEEVKPWARAFLIGTLFMKSTNPEATLIQISSAIHNERGGENLEI